MANESGEDVVDTENSSLSIPEEDCVIWDLYLRMYNAMKMNLTGISHNEIFPQGWYAVVNADGEDAKILVFDNQVTGYELITKDVNSLLKNKPSALTVIKIYFDIEVHFKLHFFDVICHNTIPPII